MAIRFNIREILSEITELFWSNGRQKHESHLFKRNVKVGSRANDYG